MMTVVIMLLAAAFSMLGMALLQGRGAKTEQNERLQQLHRSLQGSGLATWEWNITRNLYYYDPAFFTLMGMNAEANGGRSLLELLEPLVHPLDRDYFLNQFNAHTQSHDHRIQLEFRIVRAQWHCQWLELQAHVFHTGKELLISGTLADITTRKIVETLPPAAVSLVDPLTQLPNRSYLLAKAEYLIHPEANAFTAALCILRIDDYPSIKKDRGAAVADLVLKIISVRLKKLLRQNDMVARLGGADFCILLPFVQKAQVLEVCQKLVTGLQEPINADDRMLVPKHSMGIAILPQDGEDYLSLMSKADAAASLARSERSGFCFYEPQRVHPPIEGEAGQGVRLAC